MLKLKKAVSLVSAIALTVSFAGCGKNEETVKTTDGKTFSLWTVMDSNSSVSLKSYNDMLFYQELEKATGVHIDFIHPIAGSTGSEAFVTMVSGNDIPDIIEYNWSSYTGGPDQAIEDELIISLNDYLKDHAPNYYDYMEGQKGEENNYLYKIQTMSEAGHYYGFHGLNIGEYRAFAGIIARADKLREYGMDIPETIDDWTAFFAKAKADGFEDPLTLCNENVSFGLPWPSNAFNTAFDVGKDMYIEDDKVVFAPFQPGFKEYVAQMADWVKQGYLDTGFVTNDSVKLEGNMANGKSVATFYSISTIGSITNAARKNDPNFELVGCPYPSSQKGVPSKFKDLSSEASSTAFAISESCGNKEKAVEWCDYIYSEEGMLLRSFGVEGDTYTVTEKDGVKTYAYSDKILDLDKSGANNVFESIYKYVLPANHPGLNQHPDYLNSLYTLDEEKEALVNWNTNNEMAKVNKLPSLSFTEEEAREKTDIFEVAQNELEIAITDIILGKASIDTYDEAVAAAKKAGYDRAIEIYQAAYDRYINK